MSEPESNPGGMKFSLRRLGNSLLGLLQTRVELLAAEFQEERLRTIRLLVWVAVALAIGIAGLQVAIGALAIFLWGAAGYWGLAGLAAVTLVASGILLGLIERHIIRSPAPFAATTAEFKKDIKILEPHP